MLEQAKILIVCSRPQGGRQLAQVVEDNNGQPLLAPTPSEALALATKQTPRVVVLRENDNRGELLKLCRQLRRAPGIMNLPILVVVSRENLGGSGAYMEAGATEVVAAPSNPSEMVLRIFSVMRMHELKGELEWLYHRLNDIGNFTAQLSREFNPAYLEFPALMETLMRCLLVEAAADASTPRRILTFTRSPRGKWHVGAFFLGSGDEFRSLPELTVLEEEVVKHFALPRYELLALNQGEELFARVVHDGLWAALDQPPPKTNLVVYWTKELGVVATDFPGRVYLYHARAIASLSWIVYPFLKTISTQLGELEGAFRYIINALARAAEAHDEHTWFHLVRVNKYSELLAREMGCERAFVRTISYSAQMHDVGKLHIPPEILKKPGPLTPEEWERMKIHPISGALILGDHPRLEMAREIALSHHECYDGSGYPYGLKGEEIPLAGRIVMMADVYDALRSPRPYKPAFDHDKTYKIITKGDRRLRPEAFDPQVLQCFCDLHQRFNEIYEENND